jgi:flagellar biosynthesis GTPase FlhF
MRIKSYFVDAVADAVQAARKEMGEEAMLVETRKAPPQSQHLGTYEVVFGVNPAELAAGALVKPVSTALPPSEMARFTGEMAQMRRQLEGIRLAMRSGLTAPRWLLPSSSLADVFSTMLAADISGEVAQAVVDRLHAQLSPAELEDTGALTRALAAEMERRFTVDPKLGKGESSPRVVALVGPPGSGKTTTARRGRRSIALLRSHPGSRVSSCGDGGGAHAGARRSSLEVSHPDRYAGLLPGEHGRRGGSGARAFRARNRCAPGPNGFDEIRRFNSCSGSVRDLPAG